MRQDALKRQWWDRRGGRCVVRDDLAATHRSLWLGSRPRTGHREIFCMKHEILLVDDDPGVRRMLLRVLEEEGYAVIPAADGLEALESVKCKAPNLVLLDLNLPFQDGWGTFERLTTEIPSLPIIIITARPNQLFPALAAGAGALMEKPLELPKLLRTIRDLLAEPITNQMARMTGQASEFHYLPSRRSEPLTKRREEHVR